MALVALALFLASCAQLKRGAAEPGAENLTAYLEQRVAQARGLALDELPAFRECDRRELLAAHRRRDRRRWPAAEIERSTRIYRALGLLRPGEDLERIREDLLAFERGGCYDPASGELLLLEPAQRGPADLRGMTRAIHDALIDRHLDRPPVSAAYGGDAAAAAEALMQGSFEATAVEMRAADHFSDSLTFLPARLAAEQRIRGAREEGAQIASLRDPQARARLARLAPGLLGILLFASTQGPGFARALRESDGWWLVDRALGTPPLSSEQILHPDKYLHRRDDPVAIAIFPGLSLPEPWQIVAEDVLGENGIRQFLRTFHPRGRAASAAAGWGGDRLFVVAGEAGELALGWHTEWDSAADAREFAREVAAALVAKIHFEDSGYRAIPRIAPPEEPNFELLYAGDRRVLRVATEGRRVLVVQGLNPDLTDRVLAGLRAGDEVHLPAAHSVRETGVGDVLLWPASLLLDWDSGDETTEVGVLRGSLLGGAATRSGWWGNALAGGLCSFEDSDERFRLALLAGMLSIHTMPRAGSFALTLFPLLEIGSNPEGFSWGLFANSLGSARGPGYHALRTGIVQHEEWRALGFGEDGAPVEGEVVRSDWSWLLGLVSNGFQAGRAPGAGAWHSRRLSLLFSLLFAYEDRIQVEEPQEGVGARESSRWSLIGSLLYTRGSARLLFGSHAGERRSWSALAAGALYSDWSAGAHGGFATPVLGWRSDSTGRFLTLFYGLLPLRLGEGEPRGAPAARPRGFVRPPRVR